MSNSPRNAPQQRFPFGQKNRPKQSHTEAAKGGVFLQPPPQPLGGGGGELLFYPTEDSSQPCNMLILMIRSPFSCKTQLSACLQTKGGVYISVHNKQTNKQTICPLPTYPTLTPVLQGDHSKTGLSILECLARSANLLST